ncbi:MAG: ComF family protein [Phycisphaerales bacterium]|nr:ComF family protein [Phycisphaerales bacterium]
MPRRDQHQNGSFTWPPRDGQSTIAGNVITTAPREPARPGFDRWLRPGPRWWTEFERAFLAPTHEPIARRAAELGWHPDAADAYCPRCAGTVGPHEVRAILGPGSALGCNDCRDRRLRWARAVRLGPYAGPLRDWIQELKFERFRPAGRDLGRLLGERLMVELAAAGVEPARAVLVPIPMSRRRRLARGIDHTLVLARGIREVTGLPIARALARRHRPSQLEVPASQRRANASRSFRVRRGAIVAGELRGKVVVVVDDVRTTGATLTAACRALSRALRKGDGRPGGRGVKVDVWTAVAGVTPRPGESGRGSAVAERGGEGSGRAEGV